MQFLLCSFKASPFRFPARLCLFMSHLLDAVQFRFCSPHCKAIPLPIVSALICAFPFRRILARCHSLSVLSHSIPFQRQAKLFRFPAHQIKSPLGFSVSIRCLPFHAFPFLFFSQQVVAMQFLIVSAQFPVSPRYRREWAFSNCMPYMFRCHT